MSNPQSTINICSGVRLNPSYEHTIYFASATAQQNYFAGKVVKTFPAYSYLRKSWNIKVEATMEQAKTWTYLFFQNGTGKMYYYFITNIEYINDNTVELLLELDVMQTYMFDYELQKCFVEREHISNDTIGANVIDEGLELGELIVSDSATYLLNTNLCVLILSSINPEATTEETDVYNTVSKIDNVFTGLGVYAVYPDKFNELVVLLHNLDRWGKSDCIVAMWMYPLALIKLAEGESWSDSKVCHNVSGADKIDYTFKFDHNNLPTYTPRNKKLLTYPYQMLYVHNNAGGSAYYRLEDFYHNDSDRSDDFKFQIIGAIAPDATCKCMPDNYLKDGREEGLTIGGYPTCAWNQDVYKLWVAQNQNQNNLSMQNANMTVAASIAGGVVSLATGNIVGAGGSLVGAYHGYTQVQSLMAQKKDMAIQPPQAKGSFSNSVNVANGQQNFYFMRKAISKDSASRIDGYFDMYGYKTNEVKVPNRAVRENWTYTKTVGCHITGNICTEDQQKIESIYNNGITFWKNGDNIGDYGLSNNTL